MRKYVIMGVQGSGKGTHSAMLAEDLDLVHIGVGDILRWNVQHHTKLGAQIRRTMAAGSLVSDDVIEGVVKDRLDQHDWNYGFVIEAFLQLHPTNDGAWEPEYAVLATAARDGNIVRISNIRNFAWTAA